MKFHKNLSETFLKKSLFFIFFTIFFPGACGIKGRPLPPETVPRENKQKKQKQKDLGKKLKKEKWQSP